jgi:hypothetical protein
MTSDELNQVLRSVPVPGKTPEYWEQFPRKVRAEISRREQAKPGPSPFVGSIIDGSTRRWDLHAWLRPVLALGCALSCATLLLVLLKGRDPKSSTAELVKAQKYFGEIEALFPNQVRGVSFDDNGPQMTLSDIPDLPIGPPVFLKICDRTRCHRFVTFSGQQIKLDGGFFEVLVNGEGKVILMGKSSVLSTIRLADKPDLYRIEAHLLPVHS